MGADVKIFTLRLDADGMEPTVRQTSNSDTAHPAKKPTIPLDFYQELLATFALMRVAKSDYAPHSHADVESKTGRWAKVIVKDENLLYVSSMQTLGSIPVVIQTRKQLHELLKRDFF